MSSVEGINRLLNTVGRRSPREAIRLREQLIKSGVKGTSLFLGTASPQVIKQLETSKSQQKDPDKARAIQQQIDILESEGRVSAQANTSDISPEIARARAKTIFSKQQGLTKAITQQVRVTLDSPEFQTAKESGATLDELNTILSRNVTPASKLNSAIVNELAQAEIQGEAQTQSNIESLLEREGIKTSVNVSLDDSPLGASFTSRSPATTNIEEFIGSISDVSGIQTIPSGVEELANLPIVSGETILGLGGAGGISGLSTDDIASGENIFSGIGKVINDMLGTDIDPTTLGIAVAFLSVASLVIFIGVIT